MSSITNLVSWNARDEKVISRILKGILPLFAYKNKQFAIGMDNDFQFSANISILVTLISFEGIESEFSKRRIIRQSVYHLKTLKGQDSKAFKRVLEWKLNKYLKLPLKEWIIIFPINIARNRR